MTNQAHAEWLRIAADHLRTYTSRERLLAIADELEAKDRTIAALTAERDINQRAAAYWWAKWCECNGIKPLGTTQANVEFIHEWQALTAERDRLREALKNAS